MKLAPGMQDKGRTGDTQLFLVNYQIQCHNYAVIVLYLTLRCKS